MCPDKYTITHMDVRGIDEQKRIIVETDALTTIVVGRGGYCEGIARRRHHTLSIPDWRPYCSSLIGSRTTSHRATQPPHFR